MTGLKIEVNLLIELHNISIFQIAKNQVNQVTSTKLIEYWDYMSVIMTDHHTNRAIFAQNIHIKWDFKKKYQLM